MESVDRNTQESESGANSITLDILSKVAEVLGVTVGDITKVLDETAICLLQYRAGEENESCLKKYLICWIYFMRISICVKRFSTR